MLRVNDFKLVSLEALVHDQELFQSYIDFIRALDEVYQIEDLVVSGEINLGDDYIFEDHVLDSEVRFWRYKHYNASAQEFINWAFSANGYGNGYERGDGDFKMSVDILVRQDEKLVLGRSVLQSGMEKGVRRGAGRDCIHPDYRSAGLGRIIMAHRMAQARQMGVDEMKINVKDRNAASLARMDKLEKRGLLFDFRFAGGPITRHHIAYYKPELNLQEAYALLSNQSAPEPH